MKKVLVIMGATSTGKTDLGLLLAGHFNGELVSCDSRQVYKKLDIGTGKTPGGKVLVEKGEGFWKMDGVMIWLYDLIDPDNQYTVANYIKDANKVITDILKRGKLPILVGGSGLYFKALLEGLSNLSIPVNMKLRKELELLSREQLQRKLQKFSTEKWKEMNNSDRQNPRRLIRAIELIQMRSYKTLEADSETQNLDALKIGLRSPRQLLYQRIDERVIGRINLGMIEEAEDLHRNGLSFERMRQLGLEYGILADYLDQKIATKEELITVMQGKIHGYARRQLTWFRKGKDVVWFDIADKDCIKKVENLVAKWYDNQRYAAEN